MSEILASVVMATYNQGPYLRQALDSVLDQTLDHSCFEIIVVNDGATDATSEILSDYKTEVLLIEHDNRGLVSCCNEALEVARGRYFARVDSDDIVDPAWLQLLLDALRARSDACGAVPDRMELHDGRKKYVAVDSENIFSMEACGTLFRTKRLHEVGGFREFFWEEYDLYLRLLSLGELLRVPHGLYTYRRHQESMTADNRRRTAGWEQLLEEWGSAALTAAGADPELCRILKNRS